MYGLHSLQHQGEMDAMDPDPSHRTLEQALATDYLTRLPVYMPPSILSIDGLAPHRMWD